MKSIPTWGWVLIVVAVITVTIIAFRKPLKAWMDKQKANSTTKVPPATTETATRDGAAAASGDTVLQKMRRVG